MTFVWVPTGSFMMGNDNGQECDKPAHRVELDGFWIGKTEVTVAQWRSVVGSVPATNDQGDDHPIVNTGWLEVKAFCDKAGVVLPTEAQWEYAARGPEGRVYPWGDTPDASLCQTRDDLHGHLKTAPVGSIPGGASWCGAMDMAGNAWEWGADLYDDAFYKSPAATLRNAANLAPNPNLALSRPMRGGGWNGYVSWCRSSNRGRLDQSQPYEVMGFRAALPR